MWIVSGFAAKHKVLNHKSFLYILSFNDEPQKFSPSNDLTHVVILAMDLKINIDL